MNKRYSEGNNIPYPLVSTWSDYIELDFIPSKIIILVEQINTASNFMGVYENGHFYVNAKVGSVTYFHNYSDKDIEISETKFRIKGFTSYFNNTVFSYTAVADIPILPPLPTSKLIFDGKVYGSVIYGGDDMINYSTDEQAVGTWVDGKTVYRIVVTGLGNPQTSIAAIENAISDKDINVFTTIQVMAFASFECYLDNNVKINTSTKKVSGIFQGWYSHAILEYIKTTD